ncbi:MAG: mannitol-1-phosphate 5-dehydrogenase [Armatimonadetes bacterium]|nr:mannitol-1-phosphate 5-dehydrogenase [Armatimonadota bacterium]
MKTALQFGAGNIGRGFTGQLFSESGLEVVFVDVAPEIVEKLNELHQYSITVASEPEETIPIRNVRAVNGRDIEAVAQEVVACEVAATAVGVNVLSSIAAPIARGLTLRRNARPDGTLNIIVCENMQDAAGTLKSLVSNSLDRATAKWVDERIGFTQAVVGRMVPVRTGEERLLDPLGIRVEAYKKLPVDADALRGELPDIVGVQPRANFQAYVDSKLYAHNAGHAASAYFGARRGFKFIWECMEDAQVHSLTRAVMEETGQALVKRYGLDSEEHQAHIEDLLSRFGNRKLADTVARVGADPVRKLGRDDRLVGGALFCLEQGVEPVYVAKAVAAGLEFCEPGDPSAVRIQSLIREAGVRRAFEEICGVAADSPLGKLVLDNIKSQ